MAFISVLLQIFWQKFYKNVSGVVLYQPYEFCPNHWIWLMAMATEMRNVREKKKTLKNLLRSIWGMKLKLCIHVHDSSLYINYVLCCCCPCAFVAIGLWEKWKLAFISVLLQTFWQKFYRNVLRVVLYQPYKFYPKSLILIGGHGNRKAKFFK